MSSLDEVGIRLMDLVRWQVDFGLRYPGSESHQRFRGSLVEEVRRRAGNCGEQRFTVPLFGRPAECANIYAVFGRPSGEGRDGSRAWGGKGRDGSRAWGGKGRDGSRAWDGKAGPLLLGTHFDTRARADREPTEELRGKPIPGANDGGSGTAVLLDLLEVLRDAPLRRQVVVAFFDAEDVGGLDDNPFSVGADRFAADSPVERPSEVVILDMIGGRKMVLDMDAHCLSHPPSMELTRRLRRLGAERGYAPFVARKPSQVKSIICDHYPFLRRGIASSVLIDIDYAQWHTHADLPEYVDPSSLAMVWDVVKTFTLRGTPEGRHQGSRQGAAPGLARGEAETC